MKEKYNLTINGLRGFAVLLVFFFHLEFSLFKGGFIGVDIFFVISGYLISNSILNQIDCNNFSFKKYFEKRLRRILPSFLVVLWISYLIINIIFIDEHLRFSLKEILYSLFFIQNFYYWDLSGYFGLENLYKPLLNTWSLGVEFQFYLLFPLFYFFFRKYIFILVILSLIISIFFAARNFAYFLIFTRFFEFGFGIFIFFLKKNKIFNQKLIINDFFFIIGILLVCFSILYLDMNKSFPGINALPVCFGSAIIIYFSETSRYHYLINNNFFKFFGDISYSLYLVHWPLIIFYKYTLIKINLVFIDQIIILFLSIFLSYFLTYKFEIYYYKKNVIKPRINFSYLIYFYALFVIFIIIHNYYYNYNYTQIPKESYKIAKNKRLLQLSSEPFLDNDKKKILLIGDSHALDLSLVLKTNSLIKSNYQIRYIGLDDQCLKNFLIKENLSFKIEKKISSLLKFGATYRCLSEVLLFQNSSSLFDADLILINNRYNKAYLKYLEKFISFLKQNKKKVILINNNPVFIDPSTLLKLHEDLTTDEINKKFYHYQDKSIFFINKKLKEIANRQNISYVDKYNLICNHELKSCKVVDEKRKLLFDDRDHFSNLGYELYGETILDSKLFDLIK